MLPRQVETSTILCEISRWLVNSTILRAPSCERTISEVKPGTRPSAAIVRVVCGGSGGKTFQPYAVTFGERANIVSRDPCESTRSPESAWLNAYRSSTVEYIPPA